MLEALDKTIKELFEKSSDPEVIKKYAEVKGNLDTAREEEQKLIERNAVLTKSYKDAIINSTFKREETKDVHDAPKSLNDIIKNVVEKRQKGGKQ